MSTVESTSGNNLSLTTIISSAIQIPGIRVNRDAFLREVFKNETSQRLQLIADIGPVEAGCSREELRSKANKILKDATMMSTAASFAAGIPGGLAMAATIPLDMMQFYSVALKMAQEISYLYGEGDLWQGHKPDDEKITNQLVLYCGVMLGATGAAQAVRVLSTKLAQQAMRKLSQKALTKTFYYPIVKSIAKAFGARMTKGIFAKGVSKAIPLVGGFISGGITFATFPPMGNRLIDVLDETRFSYSEADLESDINEIAEVSKNEESVGDIPQTQTVSADMEVKNESMGIVLAKIQEVKQMLDAGMINEEEFSKIKSRLLADI